MAKWSITGTVVGGKYIGEVEADTEEQAMQKGFKLPACHVGLCHQCASECENGEIDEIHAEKIED